MTSSPTIRLGSRVVGPGSSPYLIAEIGVNHEGSVSEAKKLIDLAAEGGCDAAKFQTYKAETLASKHSPSYWDTTKESTSSQFELFQKYDSFEPEDYETLAEHCNDVGIDFVSTPFDDEAIEFLDPLVPFFKVASADLTNIPFLRKIAAKGKPLILSTGASNLAEIAIAVQTLEESGAQELALLHCILNYPTSHQNAHLGMIKGLQRAFPHFVIGYSDHTVPDSDMSSLHTAFLLGAVVLEKHFTNDKKLPGNDHYHAMDVKDAQRFKSLANTSIELIGNSEYKRPIISEEISRTNARRSIVLNDSATSGTILSADLLTYKRPGTGISPLHWDSVLGRKINKDLTDDHILQWSDLI